MDGHNADHAHVDNASSVPTNFDTQLVQTQLVELELIARLVSAAQP